MIELCKRIIRYRLIIPLIRNPDSAYIGARGVALGLFVACTPTVGVQMLICAGIWGMVVYLLPQYRFSLLVSCAWTWVTNIFTMVPIYYVFYLTGKIMFALINNENSIGNYEDFATVFANIMAGDEKEGKGISAMLSGIHAIWHNFGLPMFIGSVPWAILASVVGYIWSLKYLKDFQKSRISLKNNI